MCMCPPARTHAAHLSSPQPLQSFAPGARPCQLVNLTPGTDAPTLQGYYSYVES